MVKLERLLLSFLFSPPLQRGYTEKEPFMALLQHFKAEPTDYILAYTNGKVFRQGTGKAFWYWRHKTSIVMVPTSTRDALFVLNESTSNFQTVTLQGQITYRIVAPQTVAGLLNFTIDPRTRQYLSDDPEKLNSVSLTSCRPIRGTNYRAFRLRMHCAALSV